MARGRECGTEKGTHTLHPTPYTLHPHPTPYVSCWRRAGEGERARGREARGREGERARADEENVRPTCSEEMNGLMKRTEVSSERRKK